MGISVSNEKALCEHSFSIRTPSWHYHLVTGRFAYHNESESKPGWCALFASTSRVWESINEDKTKVRHNWNSAYLKWKAAHWWCVMKFKTLLKKTLGEETVRPRHRWEIIDRKLNRLGGCGANVSNSRWGPSADSCECGNKSSDSTRRGIWLAEWLSASQNGFCLMQLADMNYTHWTHEIGMLLSLHSLQDRWKY
jgi:hypothetical protein